MTIVAAILTIVTLLLPLLVKWIDAQMEKPDGLDVLTRTHAKEIKDMASAMDTGTAVDVATVWARHDQLLRDAGLSYPGSGSDRSKLLRNLGELRRNIHSVPGVDAGTSGVRAVSTSSFRTVRTASGAVIPILD